jgi:hypothetical protein
MRYHNIMEIKSTSYRLPEKITNLITILSEKLLISKTAVVTLAVLYFADKQNADNPKPQDKTKTD